MAICGPGARNHEQIGCTSTPTGKGVHMRYVLLMKLTDQGARDVKGIPQRISDGMAAFEKMGGKVLSFHMTMGEYDYVAVGEGPNDEMAAAFSLALASSGSVRTTTLKAFTPEEIAPLIAALP